MGKLYISYENFNGGTNNLCVVQDKNGRYGRSTKGQEQAIKNYYRNLKRKV